MFLKNFCAFVVFLFLTGCVYPYATQVKFASLDGSLKPGNGIGPIKGEDCTLYILTYGLGDSPSVDQAIINASLGVTNPLTKMGIMGVLGDKEKPLRYIVNMHVEQTSFSVLWFFSRKCIKVTGLGYE